MNVINPLITSIKNNIRQYTMVIALIVVMLIFTFLTDGTFMTPRNLSNLLIQTSHIAILACGIVLIIVAGHIDLSIGSVVGFTGAIAAVLQVNYNMGTVQAIMLTLFSGAVIGLWQGYWVAYRGVPAFIVTLAGMLFFQGTLLSITKGATVAPMNDSYKAIGQNYIPNIGSSSIHVTTLILGIIVIAIYNIYEIKKRKERIKYNFEIMQIYMQLIKMLFISAAIAIFFGIMILYKGMPWSIVLVLLVAGIFTFITQKTKFGRYVYAIGGNKEAAKLSGINIKRITLGIFTLMGILYSLSGIVYSARLNSAAASAGKGMELEVIAAAIIGGTSTMGGEGTIVGAIIGALVMATLNNGMSLMNSPSEWQYMIKGLILLGAVWVDIASRRNKK